MACPEDGLPSGLLEIIKMAQNSQVGTAGTVSQNAGLQLQIPGMEQFEDLKFIQGEANPADLIVQLPDGTEVVFPNYIPLAQAGSPPALTLEDGTVIPGQEIVSLIDNLNYDLIAPGAGDQGGDGPDGGGAGFVADPSGLLGDDIGHGPYAGGIALADQVGFEQLPGWTGPDDGGGDLPFEAIDDHVIHNIQAGPGDYDNPIDIPDVALRHNDIYPRGDWDLTSVDNPGPSAPPQSNFEPETAVNSAPADGNLDSTEFGGSNTTARFDQGPIPIPNPYDNDGDTISELQGNDLADENGLSGDFVQPVKVTRQDWDLAATNLHTVAPNPSASGGTRTDWDGASIYLYAGETITMTSGMNGNAADVILAIDDPNVTSGGDPLVTGQDLNWDVTNEVSSLSVDPNTGVISSATGDISTGASISYLVDTTGWHYVGTGFATNVTYTGPSVAASPGGTPPPVDYYTRIEIDGVPYGEFDYTATDGVLSDGAHVIVDAIEESNPGGRSVLNGDGGDDIIISGDNGDDLYGNGGQDVLIGRGGDDHLTGGADRDLFLFENAVTDGNDTIFDFNAAEGDIMNLDALFDALGVASADREVLDTSSGGDTILTIGDGSGAAHAGATGFSITLDGTASVDVAGLTTSGNLVVDES
jgi:hypothetical protein